MSLDQVSDEELLAEVRRRWPVHVFPEVLEPKVITLSELADMTSEGMDEALDRAHSGPLHVVDEAGKIVLHVQGQYRPIPCDCECELCQLCRNRYEEGD